MRVPRRRWSRAELTALAVKHARRFARPGVILDAAILHDRDCPMLAGRDHCDCDVQLKLRRVRPQ